MLAFVNKVINVIQDLSGIIPGGLAGYVIEALLFLALVVPFLWIAWKMLPKLRAKLAKVPGLKRLAAKPVSGLTARSLVRVWRRFLKQIPGEFRRVVLGYKPFVVLGPAGAGKTALVNRYTDWQGQAAKFYSSYATEHELQIYLGSRELVQEIPSFVLEDVTQTARRALSKLWGRLFRKREPICVVAINASELRRQSPDALRRQAQLLRGKLNVLSRVRRGPVKVRLVLTHMDKVEGYLALSQFLNSQKIALRVPLQGAEAPSSLGACLERYERFLPRGLVNLSFKAYSKVLRFLKDAPGLFAYVEILVNTLTEPEPLSHAPEVTTLFLTSEMSTSPVAASNPFSTAGEVLGFRSSRQLHRRVATIAAGLALGWIGGSFLYDLVLDRLATGAVRAYAAVPATDRAERVAGRLSLIDARTTGVDGAVLPRFFPTARPEATRAFAVEVEGAFQKAVEVALEAVRRFEMAPDEAHAQVVDARLDGLARWERPPYTPSVPPAYFRGRTEKVRERYTQLLRKRYILPALGRATRTAATEGRLLFLLGLLYATDDNQLGTLVVRRANEDEATPDLPVPMVARYVRYRTAPWDELPEVGAVSLEGEAAPLSDLQPWLAFFLGLKKDLNRPYLTLARLGELKQRARKLSAKLQRAAQDPFSQEVYYLLGRDTKLDLEGILGNVYVEEPRVLATIRKALDQVAVAPKAIPQVAGLSLPGLLDELDALKAQGGDEDEEEEGVSAAADDELGFALGGRSFSFDPAAWRKLVSVTRMRALIQRYTALERRRSVFFAEEGTSYPPVRFNRKKTQTFLFPSKARVPGIYSRTAFDDGVRKVLNTLQETVDAAGLDDETKEALEAFVQSEVKRYAAEYAARWTKFFQRFQVDADSLGSLLLAVQSMQKADSPFGELLEQVGKAVALPDGTGGYLAPMADALAPFRFVIDVQSSKKGGAGIDQYRRILGQVEAALKDKQVEAKEKDQAALGPFVARLSPLARIALPILRDDRDSPLKLVERWLDENGVEDEWRGPFLAPIQTAFRLGLDDLGRAVGRSWNREVLPSVVDLVTQFPFAPEAKDAVSPGDVSAALHPTKGLFWKRFRTLVAPVLAEEDGSWKALSLPDATSRLPKGARSSVRLPVGFAITDKLVALRDGLFDGNGTPQAVTLHVYPNTLPFKKTGEPAGTLSFLRSGKAVAFGFNQKRAWQTFSWEWWQPYPCQAGLQIENPGGGDPWFRTLTERETWWGLLKLLQRGTPVLERTWRFQLKEGGSVYEEKPFCQFSFREDPWGLFAIAGLLPKALVQKAAAYRERPAPETKTAGDEEDEEAAAAEGGGEDEEGASSDEDEDEDASSSDDEDEDEDASSSDDEEEDDDDASSSDDEEESDDEADDEESDDEEE